MSGSADLGGSAALGKFLLGGHDPLALATKHSKAFWALTACADSRWDVIWTDPGRSREVGLQGNGTGLAGFRQKTGTGRDITPPSALRPFKTRGAGRGLRVIAAWETKSKRGRRFVRVLLNQLKALDILRNFPNFIMSSPSIPVVSPADLDKVVVVRDWSQLSMVVVVDFPEVPKRTKFCPVLPKGKGASLAVIHGKRRASPLSGAGPSKRLRGCVPLERSSSPPVPIPSIMEVFLRKQVEALTTSLAVWEGELQRAREDRDVAWMEKEAMEQERNTSMEGQSAGEAEGQGRAPERDALWAELEAARQREDWLANKAALGRTGILHELSPIPTFVTDGSFSGFRLGVGASGPLGWCLRGVHVDSGRFDAGVRGSASGVAAGDGAIGEVVDGAPTMQCGGPGVVVGGGG
ncbi:hypothetical protein E4T56_gene3673 [Termitomyces sp. T112]|nr:hypothetical protein E4T56_gene3673 [Termitomyces sp. T112]